MHYFDTSFIAPLFLPEAKSNYVEKILQSIPQKLHISHWLEVEFSSLISRNVRMKLLSQANANFILNNFKSVINDSFELISPKLNDFKLATEYLQNSDSGLRSGDALHLAIAQNNGAKKFYTFDKILLKAINKLTTMEGID